MSNRLIDMLEGKNIREQTKIILQEMIEDQHCRFCKNAELKEDSNMSTSPYCTIHQELMLDYPTQLCLFFELDESR